MADTYKCEMCGGVYKKMWSDEEATVELNNNFPGFTPDECGIVCDDCYKSFCGAGEAS